MPKNLVFCFYRRNFATNKGNLLKAARCTVGSREEKDKQIFRYIS
jgi:hypothetical protein